MATNPAVRRLADWSSGELHELAETHGTPLYVIDLDRLRENLERLRGALPDADIHYAAKANAGQAVLETIADTEAGVECASWGEVHRALEAGFSAESVLYTPVNPPARDLDAVVDRWRGEGGLTITAGAMDTIRRLADRGYDGRLAIRIHPGTGAGHGESVATGADAKFGIPLDLVPKAVTAASGADMDVVGLHAHVGSGIFDEDIDAYLTVVEQLSTTAGEIDADLEFVDVGGGLGVPYGPDQDPLDLQQFAEVTREALADRELRTVLEPGRYLVADAGVLLTRVTTIKEASSGVLAGVDAGMTDLLRPALYDASHEIRNLSAADEDRSNRRVSVVGPICESTDVFATGRDLPGPERGDILAIGNAGAYGIEMASQYNSRPRPPVIALEGEEATVVRRRETIGDITTCEET